MTRHGESAGGSRGRAVIVGAGPGGLTAAIALRRAGFSVVVVERASELKPIGSGLGLTSNALNALRQIDAADRLMRAGEVCEVFEVRTRRGALIFTAPFGSVGEQQGAPTIGIHRADLQAELLALLPPGTVRVGARCTGFVREGRRVAATFETGAPERGDILIAADGYDSVVRRQLLGPERERRATYLAWVGIAPMRHPALPPRYTLHYWGRGERFGLIDIGAGRVYWWATKNGSEPGPDVRPSSRAEVLRFFARWPTPVPDTIEATDDAAILRIVTRDRKPARRWGTGPVTLVGDAAHPMLTSLAQGACAAIEDGVALGAALAQADDLEAGLRAYEARRIPPTSQIVRLTRTVSFYEQLENGLACRVRDAIFKRMPARMIRKQCEWLLSQRE